MLHSNFANLDRVIFSNHPVLSNQFLILKSELLKCTSGFVAIKKTNCRHMGGNA